MSTMSLMIGIFGVKLQLNDESKPLGEEGKFFSCDQMINKLNYIFHLHTQYSTERNRCNLSDKYL